ncbi:MAG TPA: Wzz/FepE/Etk N-terminal domain-containing protein [Clostridia bacterium]
MEEFSLRGIVNIIIKGKWIISITTIIAVLIAIVATLFVMKPAYESEAVFIMAPVAVRTGINPNSQIIYSGDAKSIEVAKSAEDKMLGSMLSQLTYPQYDSVTIMKMMKSREYLEEVFKSIGINVKEKDYEKIVDIQYDLKKTEFTIITRYGDGKTAERIRDEILNGISDYLKEKINDQILINEQYLSSIKKREAEKLQLVVKDNPDFIKILNESNQIDKIALDKQLQFQDQIQSYKISTQTLDACNLINNEFQNMKLIDINKELNMQIFSKTNPPYFPSSPSKSVNVSIAVILALTISLFVLFIREYWNREIRSAENI